MNELTNSQQTLLKEYIKTLLATDVVFPGIQPRQWGQEFSQAELDAILVSLKTIISTADPDIEQVLIDEFIKVKQGDNYLHWFVCAFWREIVGLLEVEATVVNRQGYLSE